MLFVNFIILLWDINAKKFNAIQQCKSSNASLFKVQYRSTCKVL